MRDNVGPRWAMQRGAPLVYLFGATPGRYMPVWLVFIVRDHPEQLAFSVAVDSLCLRLQRPISGFYVAYALPRRAPYVGRSRMG